MTSTLAQTTKIQIRAGLSGYCAEMAGAFICAALGIVPSVRHADYIGSWLQIIREDNRAILRAASAASKAADYILACRDTASTDLDVAGEDEADGFELEGRLAA